MQVKLAAAIFLAAGVARADDVVELAPDPRVVPQVQFQSGFQPPVSLEEFRVRKGDMKYALKNARNDPYRESAIRLEIENLDGWYKANTHMNNPGMFIGGIVMMGVGVAGIAVGSTMIAIGVAQTCILCTRSTNNDTLVTGGIIALIGGVAVAAIGIPFTIIGHRREMGAAEVSLFIGPTSGIQATF